MKGGLRYSLWLSLVFSEHKSTAHAHRNLTSFTYRLYSCDMMHLLSLSQSQYTDHAPVTPYHTFKSFGFFSSLYIFAIFYVAWDHFGVDFVSECVIL